MSLSLMGACSLLGCSNTTGPSGLDPNSGLQVVSNEGGPGWRGQEPEWPEDAVEAARSNADNPALQWRPGRVVWDAPRTVPAPVTVPSARPAPYSSGAPAISSAAQPLPPASRNDETQQQVYATIRQINAEHQQRQNAYAEQLRQRSGADDAARRRAEEATRRSFEQMQLQQQRQQADMFRQQNRGMSFR